MEPASSISSAVSEAQKSLAPYIKSRQEAAHIRRILALHLKSQVDEKGDGQLLAPISLVSESATIQPTASKSHGLQREYLKALKANIKARQEYARLSNQTQNSSNQQVEEASLDPYLALVKQKQKYERLRILQDYIDGLASKTSAVASFLEQPAVTTSVLPQLPADIVSSASHSGSYSPAISLENLIQDLEKDILRAKMFLKSEKELLSKVQADQKKSLRRTSSTKPADSQQILKALGKTRNELINWVEEELGKAGEISDFETYDAPEASDADKPIEQAVNEVRAKYAQYLQARKRFLEAVGRPVIPDVPRIAQANDVPADSQTQNTGKRDEMVRYITPYLSELLAVSREQKSLTQQRSHLTTSLAKQNKETLQVFDRLAEESHLLVKYPLPPQSGHRNRGMAPTFADEMGIVVKETPGVSHRAKEWTYAAEAASIETMEAVCMSVDEGKAAVEEATKVLESLEGMLGYSIRKAREDADGEDVWIKEAKHGGSRQKMAMKDIWSTIDGNLGVLEGTR